MDRRLVGKWYNKELGETLNIFDETPLRMKMSFSSTGHYNFDPNCVYEKDDYLCFEINDEFYRMIYHIRFAEGCLEGYHTQFGVKTPVLYTLVSDKPEDEPYRFVPTKIHVPEPKEKRIDILRKYAAYDRTHPVSYETEYMLGGEIPSILEKYNFLEYVKNTESKTDNIVFKLFDFVCDHFGHNGSGGMPPKCKIEDIVAFCEAHDRKTNCRGLAILLASLLRLYSVKARHITCMPFEDPFDDCHVVVDCLLPSGKRIMLDPTWRLYLKDSGGNYVSLENLRKMLIADEPFFVNEDASYNGFGQKDPEKNHFDQLSYRNYMTKNTLRFSRGTYIADGYDNSRPIELIPAKYPIEQFPDSAKENFVYDDTAFWEM